MKVVDIIQQGCWNWPRQRSRCIQEIMVNTPSSFTPSTNKPDEVVWSHSSNGSFSTKTTSESIKKLYNQVPWYSLVQAKHTQMCLHPLGYVKADCPLKLTVRAWMWILIVFCATKLNGLIKIFSSFVPYSAIIWGSTLCKNGVDRNPLIWVDEIVWAIQHHNKKNFTSVIYNLSLASTVYQIWNERKQSNFHSEKEG